MSDKVSCTEKFVQNTALGFAMGTAFETASLAKDMTNMRLVYPVPVMAEFAKTVGARALQFGLVGAVYTGGACLAAGIRGKEDPFNYGIGGILVGGLYGLKAKRLQSGFYAAFVLGAAGVFCAISEDVVVKNWALDAEERKRSNGPYLQEKRL